MALIHDLNVVIAKRQFKQGDHPFVHELCRNCAASDARKPLGNKLNVLARLDDANLVFAALCLNWNHIVATVPIYTA